MEKMEKMIQQGESVREMLKSKKWEDYIKFVERHMKRETGVPLQWPSMSFSCRSK